MNDDGKTYIRGGRKYIRPYGWNRVALNVKDKYDDTEWIGGIQGTLRTEGVDKLQNATDAYVPIVWFEDGVEELNDEAMVQVNTVP